MKTEFSFFVYIKTFLQIGLFYVIVVGAMYIFQDWLMYWPSANVPLDKDWQMVVNDNKSAVLGYEIGKTNKKIVVLFHGNAGSAADRIYYKNIFPSNVHLIIAEYPGFGANYHDDISKDKIIFGARQLLEHVKKKYKDKDLILVGESLGTGVASQMAKEYDIKSLILFTPYSSIEDVASRKYWWLPVSWLLKDNFNSIENLQEYTGKTLFVLSGKDKVIPYDLGDKLYKTIPSEHKTRIFVPNAGHMNWWIYMDDKQKKSFYDFL